MACVFTIPSTVFLITSSGVVYVVQALGVSTLVRPPGQIYTAERPFQLKLGFCTGLTKLAIATRVLYEILSFFLWIIGTLWVIDSTSKGFWLLYKIFSFGPEKPKTKNPKKSLCAPA